jgi:hypothetical protein
VEKMKYYTFKRESNDFNDILKDQSIKSQIKTKIKWHEHLLVGLSDDTEENLLGYIVLKYGDDMVNHIDKDYTPIPGVDYIPKRN